MSWIFAYYAAVQGLFYISTTGRIQLPTKLLLSFFAAYLAVNAVTALRNRGRERVWSGKRGSNPRRGPNYPKSSNSAPK